MKSLVLLFLVLSHLYAEVPLYDHPQWKKLLHYKNGEYKIISKEFFLSSTTNPSLSEELNATLNGLNSSDGQQIACQFPARYEWLKSKGPLPQYDLNQCVKLLEFEKKFPRHEIDIAYKIGTMDSAAGYFGHNYLIFKDESNTYDSAVAVEVYAKTDYISILSYIYEGLSGHYKAGYSIRPFYHDINSEIRNNRSFHMYKLNLSQNEIKTLLYHLYELKDIQLNYYYFNGNCTSYLDDWINLIQDDSDDNSHFIYAPSDLSKIYRNNIIQESAISLDDYHYKLIDKFNELEKIKYLKARFLEDNFNTVKEIKWIDYNRPKFNINDPSTFSINVFFHNDIQGTSISYSFYDKTIQDQYNKFEQRADLSLLTVGLDIENNHTSLNRFNLINFNKYSFDEYSSLHFHSGLNRENKDYRLRYENEFGKGLPVRTGNLITYMTLNGGFENIDFYLKPSIRTYYEFSDNTRIGAGYYHKFIGSDFYQTELMFERKINTFDVTVRYTENNGQENQRLMLGIGYHF